MELIIFDCDGTLVDSEFLCNLAMEQQLAEMGFKVDAAELTIEYRGVSLAKIMSSLEARLATTFPSNFETEYRLKVLSLFDEHLKPNEGVVELIESLTIPFCIASSGPRKKIEHALKVTGLDKYFKDNIFSAHEVGSWKPDPGLFLHAAETMKVDPANCYVVEDSLVGLQAANNAKMKCVYYAPEETEKSPLASLQAKHMSELIGKLI
ncbi:HAD family hydrolase [Psychromonas algicola]|uniref:HAD family hydrolase n=1 Tax=Psychromonas algicola TaxID=2555642 RepID=UPI001067DB34|nr:HAD family hydrolase [Psychromonas sp. RZ5]TEW51897.1 HAD family hydrolase [Psychromonas sp. RZ5]